MDRFNVILGHHSAKSPKFWDKRLPEYLNKQFECGLSEFGILSFFLVICIYFLLEQFDFSVCRNQIDKYQLINRIHVLSGIKLTGQAIADLKNDPKAFKVVLPDVESMEARVKYMNTVSLAEGNALALQVIYRIKYNLI